MRIPSPVVELDESHSPFGQTSCYETVIGETGLARFRSILCVHRSRLFANIHRIGRVHLHPKRHLVLRDACHRLGVSNGSIGLLIHVINGVEHAAAQFPADTLWIVQIEHRLSVRAALHALVHAWEESRTPQLFTAIGRLTARKKNDKAWQILILSPETINNPRSKRCVS